MAGIIKNQILKHLSRYVKNLSSDKINLSTFKGEGDLRNLELDEEVMTELLSLPTWMKLTRATCNLVLIRIPWTKLKSIPIHLSLDEVSIRVEACEELRTGNLQNPTFAASGFGKYGFVNKVIDGITATVNSVEIIFHSKEFESKVQISRIRLESRAPDWSKVELSGTRLKDMNKGETLLFKEMEWQTLRLEARSTSDSHLAPLRLLTNQAKAHIVIKKKLNDSQVLGCRLSLILDDLIWVLTDSQILAALHFTSSLSGLVKQATETTQRIKAARKLESLPEYQAQISQTSAMNRTPISKFDIYDVKETSYHFVCEKIDLHFCDDPGSGRSQHPDLKDGGAFQLSLTQVMVDFYPYHLAKGSRKHWQKYSNNTIEQWLAQSLQGFKISLIETLSTGSMHSPLIRTHPQGQVHSSLGIESNPVKEEVTSRLGKLMSTCLVVKVQDLCIFRVTTSSKRTAPFPFVSTFIERPKDLPVIHTEFCWYYYPGEICFPLPSPKIYAYLHPVQINLDVCTILWLNSFLSNLHHAMEDVNPPEKNSSYVDVRLEVLMPKIIFENTCEYTGQKERPRALHIQVSRVTLSNFRSSETGTLHQLTQCIELLQRGDLIYGSDFPSKDTDVPLLHEKFVKHAEGQDKLRTTKKLNCTSFTEIASDLTQEFLWTDSRDVWYINLNPCWLDFHVEEKKKDFTGTVSTTSKKKGMNRLGQNDGKNTNTLIYPFIDSLQVSLWIYVDETDKENSKGKAKNKNIHTLFSADGIGRVQLTHYQFLFLMRMVEAIGEMSLYLTLDSKSIIGNDVLKNLVTFVGYINSLEVSLLFPPTSDGKQESPSMEIDSVILESCNGETECENPNERLEKVNEIFTKNHLLFQRPLVVNPLSTSPMTRSLGGGSNPNLGSNSGNGFPSLGQSVKHSLTNLAVSYKAGGLSTPDSEIVSNWSNISSDSSDNFIQLDAGDPYGATVSILNTNVDGGDETDNEIEVAVEVEENIFVEERSTPSPPCLSHDISVSRADQDTITSVVTLQLQGIEIAQEGQGLNSTIKLQCKSVALKESPEICWKDFQDKFCGRKRSTENEINGPHLGSPTQRRAIKLRLTQTINDEIFSNILNSDEIVTIIKEISTPTSPRINLTDRPGTISPIRKAIQYSTDANLEVKIDLTNETQFQLHMSTCIGLSDLLEDEILPNPIPMNIDIIALKLELIEDRPPPNITSPGSIPLKVEIPSFLHISRDQRGIFQLGSIPGSKNELHLTNSSGETEEDSEKEFLKNELEKTLLQLQQCQLRNISLEQEKEENECLKGLIVNLQEEVSKLQNEKLTLLKKYQLNYH